MKSSRIITAPALLAGLVLETLAPAAEPAATDAKPARAQWEHLAFMQDIKGGQTKSDIARGILRPGKEGWELVSVANLNENGTTTKTTYYFKRPV